MDDYSFYAVVEAANIKICEALVDTIKRMDAEIAKRRLSAILNGSHPNLEFKSIVAQFLAVASCKTSAD